MEFLSRTVYFLGNGLRQRELRSGSGHSALFNCFTRVVFLEIFIAVVLSLKVYAISHFKNRLFFTSVTVSYLLHDIPQILKSLFYVPLMYAQLSLVKPRKHLLCTVGQPSLHRSQFEYHELKY